jgi:hypothetical protein
MSEHAEDPTGQASTKVVQYVSLVTMAAEALAQVRQQRAAAAAAADQQTAAGLRAQQVAAHTAARLQWKPVLDPDRRARLNVVDAGVAWASAQAWREVDPEAAVATERAQDRLRELRPDVMARFDRLQRDGVEPIEAMRRVAPFFDRPQAHEGHAITRPALAPTTGLLGAAAAQAAAGEVERTAYAAGAAVVDDPRSVDVDERLVATGRAEPHLDRAASHDQQAAALHTAAGVTVAESRTAPEIAKDGYPQPLTGEVLAGGRVKPKSAERTAPAAVRSTGLATAARAASGRTR